MRIHIVFPDLIQIGNCVERIDRKDFPPAPAGYERDGLDFDQIIWDPNLPNGQRGTMWIRSPVRAREMQVRHFHDPAILQPYVRAFDLAGQAKREDERKAG
jgi:hypothetical protein